MCISRLKYTLKEKLEVFSTINLFLSNYSNIQNKPYLEKYFEELLVNCLDQL